MSNVLVTGASGGFGALTVKILLNQGHGVAATIRNAETKNKAIAEELADLGAKIVNMDVTDEASVNAGVATAIEALGGLDVVVNNAGVGVLGIQEQFTIEDFQRLFDINVFGVQRVNRAALPHFPFPGRPLQSYRCLSQRNAAEGAQRHFNLSPLPPSLFLEPKSGKAAQLFVVTCKMKTVSD